VTGDTAKAAARRTRAGTRLFLWSCVAVVAAFGAWTTIGRLDVVSLATGEVVPASQLKTVQHLEGGIVRVIQVREGEQVRQGQELVVLEPTRNVAEVDELQSRLMSLKVTIARLASEVAGSSSMKAGGDLVEAEPELVKQAQELFRNRRLRLDNQLASQRELIAQREHEIREVKARLHHNQETVKLVGEQIAISEKLLRMDLTNRMRHLDLLKERSNLDGKIEEDTAILPKLTAAANEARARLEAIRSGFAEEAGKELEEARRTYRELSQRQLKYEDSLRRTILRAPVDGIVKTLYVHTEGGVIQAGATVLDIVPAGDELVIEARLPTQDIGYVRKDQRALVQLASAEAARFGTVEGKVTDVSPDTLVTKQGQPFYRVRIRPERTYFERGRLRYDLFPGVQVQVSILTGSRSVLEYLLDPYLASLSLAMQER
jgi:adhesin transport system membrane fusion protein